MNVPLVSQKRLTRGQKRRITKSPTLIPCLNPLERPKLNTLGVLVHVFSHLEGTEIIKSFAEAETSPITSLSSLKSGYIENNE